MVPALETSPRYLWRVCSVGMLSDPNDFGQALVVSLPLLFGLYQKGRNLRNLVMVGLPMANVLYTINLTHSRGALLGVGSLLFFGVRDRLGTVRTTLMMAIGGAGAMVFNMTGGRAYTANEESAGGRIDAWSEGLRMLFSHPLTGVGVGSFTDYHPYTAHNSFVLCFAELGLLGYFIWLGLIVVTYKGMTRAIEMAPNNSEERRMASLLRASLIGFLTCAFFLSKAFDPLLYSVLAFCICAVHCAELTYPPVKKGDKPYVMAWVKQTLTIEFLSIIVIYVIVFVKTATVGKSL
jgi:putative inorganic carbon (HCO3(-)) transporter